MANESGELPVTPEVTESPGVEIRGHSDGKASSGTSVEKVVPNYLRASTGSCHDFCKYGRKHAFDSKERCSIPNRATRKQLHHSSEGSVGGTMMSFARLSASVDSTKPTKMSTVKLKQSVDSKTWISDTSETYKRELPTKSFDSQKETGNEVLVNRNKSSLAKVKPSLLPKSHTSPSARQEISSIKEVRSPSNSTSIKVGTPSKSTSRKVEAPPKSTANKMEAPLKSTSNKVGNPSKSTSKVKASSKRTTNMVKTSSQLSSLKGKEMKLSEKHVNSLNSSSVRRKQISSMNSSEGVGGQRYSKIKTEKEVTSSNSKAASKKLMAPSKALLTPRPSLIRVASINSRKHKSLKIASHLKNQRSARKVEHEEHNNNEVEEKTLYVIKMGSENKTSLSDQNASYDDESYLPQLSSPKSSVSSISKSLSQEDQEESEYTTSEFEQDSFSGNHETECIENEETLAAEKKGKPKKGGVVYSKDNDNQMIKLKFRRGKVVENQTEISSPRRLKFRRARVPREKANVNSNVRKSFERNVACDNSNDATTGPEKVVLRHQDMQEKKDAQGLLNNVIEETASKLVEARKSKVKALVGAFETVISLHEKKPSADTVS
ncbi:hypothetical protein AAZX31_13G044400 [Glycine max]|uniref:Calmodulin-binding domain-containing protein n=2 Tax=Glycine subgen. Soja TaxID=1462606 RepID=I1LWQ1_SOYBN|nr:uncharacterized protein LOC100789388 [Glycine max]XP_028198115.1 uncharacterized protein LOC114382728 [Glycine soja]KAG4383316.1 hypothetical protein GLYMA_13G058900v4 [Glycine max]KAG4969710.1 hypothetical protein JHK85_036131 [Glycine max]KAG4976067.1 hypothetical protein JHK86_035541 [Glycine max]KAG5112141.1 hypothetical protein JHK82_035410 [Glycine max]KAG5129423.1 hypothetical protein JHK84_035820 [Glycine max]|eukprot:XP_006593685.1 uncharacterized protein LOC100789388 [Glycine max]